MSETYIPHAAPASVYEVYKIANRGVLLAACLVANIPSAKKGYAKGCFLQALDATNGLTSWYYNSGTLTSCTFTAFDLTSLATISGLTTSLAELNLLTGLVATAAEINRTSALATRVVTHGPSDANTLSLTAALHDGKTLYVTKTDGLAITLPVPVAGMKFRILIGATIASASTIKSVAGTQLMIGHALMGNDSDNTTVLFQALAASTFDTINLLGTGNSTGGIEGQSITIEAMTTTRWFVEIIGDAAGTEAIPFQDTVA